MLVDEESTTQSIIEQNEEASPKELAQDQKENEYPNSTYMVVSKVGFLLGVSKDIYDRGQLEVDIFDAMEQNKNAKIIRNLCVIRTCIEQNYANIASALLYDLKNLNSLPEYINQDALMYLETAGISIIKANHPIDKYVVDLNREIANRINNCQNLFPVWLNWQFVRTLFIMPNGSKSEGVKRAGIEYATHRNDYPFQVYINLPKNSQGNILYNDKKFVTILYASNGVKFEDMSKVTDAGDMVKEGIYKFLAQSKRTAIVVDCENSDPYKLYAMLKNLSQNELLGKINKIILYDDIHASSGWDVLKDYTQIPVEHIMLERVKEEKSFLDIRLSVGTCKEYYQNEIDSFLLASSDSDYWGLIPILEDAHFLVLVEWEKVSGAMKRKMDNAGIAYCYLDDFWTGHSNTIKENAILQVIQERLEEEVNFNIHEILHDAYILTRANLTKGEKDQFYARYIKPMHITVDADGEVYICLGKK